MSSSNRCAQVWAELCSSEYPLAPECRHHSLRGLRETTRSQQRTCDRSFPGPAAFACLELGESGSGSAGPWQRLKDINHVGLLNTVTPGERDPEKRESWDLHSYVIGDVVNDRSLIRDENYRTYTKRLQEASRFIPESLRALLHAESCSGEQRLPDLFALGLTQASSHERFPSHSAMRMESGQLIRCKAPVVRYLYGRNFSAITNYGFLGRPGFATA